MIIRLILMVAATALSFPKFADARLWIQDKQGIERPFIRNAVQTKYRRLKRFAQKKLGKQRFLVLKYRRGGITTEEQATSFYHAMQPGQKCLTLAHTKDDTEVIFGIAQLFYQKLAPSLRPQKTRSEKRELKFPKLGSRFYIDTARKSTSARGSTLQRIHGSEVAFWPLQSHEMKNLLASLTQAASHGTIVFESTANGYNHFYEWWKKAKDNPTSDWVPIFMPWFQDPRNRLPLTLGEAEEMRGDMSDEEIDLIACNSALKPPVHISLEQIKWRRRQFVELSRLFYQEYPETDEGAFLFTGSCYFDKDKIAAHLKRCRNPTVTELRGRLKIWERPKAGVEYVAGSDVGEGIDVEECDASVTTIIEKNTGKHVATLHCKWKPNEFAHRSAELCRRYNNAFWGIELQQSGHAVINTAVNVIQYPNVYKHEYYDEKKKERRKKYGWPTNVKTRPIMLDHLARAIEGNLTESLDAEFFAECQTFTGNRHGKFAATGGKLHDDRVMSYAIAWEMREYSPRLPSIYVLG